MSISIARRTFRVAALALVCGLATASARADGAFSHLAGAWSGTGTISFNSGSRERIRCRANYATGEGGTVLRLDLRCASDSYKFELRSNLSAAGGSISGTWSEITRSVSGSVTGTANGTAINVTAISPTFSAFLAVNTRGNRQSISIQSPGSEMNEVAIALARGGRR